MLALRGIRSRLRGAPKLPTVAWYDTVDASDQIGHRAGDAADRRILESWIHNGYAIVEDVVPHALIDEMLDDVDNLFTTDEPRPLLEFADLEFDETGQRQTVDHAGLLAHDVDERLAAKRRSTWRIHAMINASDPADAVRRDPELQRIASMILGLDTVASYSINFQFGSRQALHEDSAVFHLGVPNLIVGAWIACEDVAVESGPLVYSPGSHRRRFYDEFEGYPDENLRTATEEKAARYNRHVIEQAEGFEQHQFLGRKGDVLFWHGMLIHGGNPNVQPGTTRRSFVLHFVPLGADRAGEVTLPARF